MRTFLALMLASTAFFVSCDNGDMNVNEEEVNPFVGTWEVPPDGIHQCIFSHDGKYEERHFSWDSSRGKYILYGNFFWTYTYEGRIATIYRNIGDITFDLDKVRFKKTKSPTITDWLPQ